LFTEDFFDYFLHTDEDPFIVYEQDIARRAMILMMRDPRDSVVSMYHWLVTRKGSVVAEQQRIEAFVRSSRYGIERASEFVWKLHEVYLAHPGPKYLLTYERCLSNAHREFEGLLRFLDGAMFDQQAFREALHRSSFGQMRQMEVKIAQSNDAQKFQRLGVLHWSGDENELKVRKGGVGGYRQEIPWIDEELHNLPYTSKLINLIDELKDNAA
jgi:hypothetical protein